MHFHIYSCCWGFALNLASFSLCSTFFGNCFCLTLHIFKEPQTICIHNCKNLSFDMRNLGECFCVPLTFEHSMRIDGFIFDAQRVIFKSSAIIHVSPTMRIRIQHISICVKPLTPMQFGCCCCLEFLPKNARFNFLFRIFLSNLTLKHLNGTLIFPFLPIHLLLSV